MVQYLWEIDSNSLQSNFLESQQEELRRIYQKVSDQIIEMLENQSLSIEAICLVIKYEELLNFIQFCFAINTDILAEHRPEKLVHEFEEIYKQGIEDPIFDFDFLTLLSQI